MKEFEEQLKERGLTPENAYLFMHGHTLMDNVVLIMLNTVCEKLRAMSIAKITASKKQGVALKNEMSNYTNSLRSIRDVLRQRELYQMPALQTPATRHRALHRPHDLEHETQRRNQGHIDDRHSPQAALGTTVTAASGYEKRQSPCRRPPFSVSGRAFTRACAPHVRSTA